ncbi:MAG: hypothetical protein U1E49_13160 [Hyphomicrobiaceae bacterium]
MEFRLTYKGPLNTQATSTKEGKQKLRRSFHPQIADLWQSIMESRGSTWNPLKFAENEGDVGLLEQCGPFVFAPLVSQRYGWHAVAELDILFLRPSRPGALIRHGGDLDNRVKVLLDGLRQPRNADELPAGDTPSAGEEPFHCLLQDDALVTSLRVVADQLLNPPNPHWVEIVIAAKVRTTRRSMYNDVIW